MADNVIILAKERAKRRLKKLKNGEPGWVDFIVARTGGRVDDVVIDDKVWTRDEVEAYFEANNVTP